MNHDRDGYVLRPHDADERSRLELQHRVWASETDRVIAHAGFRAGDHIVDLGCGPGYLAIELARTVGPDGSVLAVDSSDLFIEHLRGAAAQEGLDWIDARTAGLEALELEAESLDGAVCRWVLMYPPDPQALVKKVARALRPGARFVIFEYFQFRSSALWPEGTYFGKVFDAVHSLIRAGGGDPDIGSRVPGLLDDAGCDVVELIPILRVGRPGSALWEWMDAHGLHHGTLVAEGLLTAADLEGFNREWQEQANLPHAFFSAPPVLATIGCKR